MLFKIYLIYSSGSCFVRQSKTICAILIEGWLCEEQFGEFIFNLDLWFRGCRLRLQYFLSTVLVVLLFSGAKHLCKVGRGHYINFACELFFKFGQLIGEEILFKEKFMELKVCFFHDVLIFLQN